MRIVTILGIAFWFLAATTHLQAQNAKGKQPPIDQAQAEFDTNQVKFDAELLELKGEHLPKEIRNSFKILKMEYIQQNHVVYWLIQLQVDNPDIDGIRKAWGLTNLEAIDQGPFSILKDADRVKIGEGRLLLEGFHYRMKKGDGVRVILQLPQDRSLDNARFVDVVD